MQSENTNSHPSHVVVIGAGAWGTGLAQIAALGGNRVTLVARRQAQADIINATHENSDYLPGVRLHDNVVATHDASEMSADLVVMAVPAQHTRATLVALHGSPLASAPTVLTAKGFEQGTMALQSEILAHVWPDAEPVVLSGPSFAIDVVQGRPTAVTMAAHDLDRAEWAATKLAGRTFRPYASADPIGVQIAGGLKNVYALAAGAVEGAGLGLSARSALIARAHAETVRLIEAMGGMSATANGLAGMGDLVLSCTSTQSRNYKFGTLMGAGHTPLAISAMGVGLAEGVHTTPVAAELAARNKIDMPLVDAVRMALTEQLTIGAIVDQLMSRPLKKEH